MFTSTVSSDSMRESIGSSIVPVDAPASPVVSNSDTIEPSLNTKPFSGRTTRAGSEADVDPEEFFEEDPTEDNDISPISSDPVDEAPTALYMTLRVRTVHRSRKTAMPQPTLPPSMLARIEEWIAAPASSLPPPSPLSSCKGPSHSPQPSVALVPALPVIPVKMLPPRKRFLIVQRVIDAEREIASLREELVTARSQITAL
ncbi:hypothetical protein Tco_1370016 [Tanacetum coccineum]